MVWREVSRSRPGAPTPGGPPTAGFIFSVNGLVVTFTSTSTDVAPGTITAYLWTFGDGSTSTSQNPVKTYAANGNYTVTLRVTDNQGNQDTDTRQVIVGAILLTRTAHGSWGLAQSLWGFNEVGPVCPTPDFMSGNQSASSMVGSGGWVDVARSRNAAFFFSPIGGNQNTKNDDGTFSTSKWISRFNTWFDAIQAISGGEAKLRAGVRDKVVRGINTLDDFIEGVGDLSVVGVPGGKNAYRFPVTFAEIQTITLHAKSRAPWLPLVCRGPAHALYQRWQEKGGGAKYTGMDGAWNQCRPRLDGSPTDYWIDEAALATAVDLSMVGGLNLSQGSGKDPAWGFVDSGGGMAGASPNEIRDWGGGAMAVAATHGFFYWSYSQRLAYWSKPEIQAAMRDVWEDHCVGRTEGPINIRGDLVAA